MRCTPSDIEQRTDPTKGQEGSRGERVYDLRIVRTSGNEEQRLCSRIHAAADDSLFDVSGFWSVAVPTWLTGAGTVGLALFAFIDRRAAREENRELRQEAREERARADRIAAEEAQRVLVTQERAQAEQVVAWSGHVDINEDSFESDTVMTPTGMRGATVAGAWIVNNSALPITNIDIHWCNPKGTGVLESRSMALIPPQERRAYLRPASLEQRTDPLPVELTFTDAGGRTWIRSRTGELKRL